VVVKTPLTLLISSLLPHSSCLAHLSHFPTLGWLRLKRARAVVVAVKVAVKAAAMSGPAASAEELEARMVVKAVVSSKSYPLSSWR
jgi:hypothetical protein